MNRYKIPNIITKNSRALTWNFCDSSQDIFLTFDDGPTPEVTDKVIDILKQYNIKGTFFFLGRNVERYPELYQQTLNEGHSVGNHSYSHLKGWKSKNNEYIDDIELASTLINSNLFRPPYGRIKPTQIKKLRKTYKLIMWDVLSADYNYSLSGKDVSQNVLQNVKPGSIIVFHDSIKASKNLLHSLPEVIENLLSQNMSFSAIPFSQITERPEY